MGPQKEIITTGSIVDHSNQQRAIIQQSAKQKIRPRSKSPSSLASSVDFERSDQISPTNQGLKSLTVYNQFIINYSLLTKAAQ